MVNGVHGLLFLVVGAMRWRTGRIALTILSFFRLIIGSRLDTDIHSPTCRIAFFGTVVSLGVSAGAPVAFSFSC